MRWCCKEGKNEVTHLVYQYPVPQFLDMECEGNQGMGNRRYGGICDALGHVDLIITLFSPIRHSCGVELIGLAPNREIHSESRK